MADEIVGTITNLNRGTRGFEENMTAAQHSIFLRGAFKRKREKEKEARQEKRQEKKEQKEKRKEESKDKKWWQRKRNKTNQSSK